MRIENKIGKDIVNSALTIHKNLAWPMNFVKPVIRY